MSTYSERKWVQEASVADYQRDGWQETGRRMTNGNGQLLTEFGKPAPAKTTKKQAAESTDEEAPTE